jgi:tRNA acetyltransferase TAN1
MSVVDGDWDELKRFNLTELYSQARNASGGSKD